MLKTFLFSALMFVSLMASGQFSKIFHQVDIENSSITWLGKKVVGQHEGTIKLQSAEFTHDDKGNITGGTFVMDMKSITCTDLTGGKAEKLVGHLASADFFDVENHPTATLQLTELNSDGFGFFEYNGNLTIKGITQPIYFVTEFKEGYATANIKIERTQYDIKYGSATFFDNLQDKAIDNEFDLTVSLKLK